MRAGWLFLLVVAVLGQWLYDARARREVVGHGVRVITEPPGATIWGIFPSPRGLQRLPLGQSGRPLQQGDAPLSLEIELKGYRTQELPAHDLVGQLDLKHPVRYPSVGAIYLTPKAFYQPWLSHPGYLLGAWLALWQVAAEFRGRTRRRFLEQQFAQGKVLPGQVIGPYEVLGLLGSGGMAKVYEVCLREDRRELRALKLLNAPGGGERFLREARLSLKLRHPNLVAFYDCGQYEGRAYLVMEKIEGRTLDQCDLSLPQRLRYLSQIAGALQELHDQAIVHRDIKPSNLMIVRGKAVLMDFGIARSLKEQAVTLQGQAVGTPGYMAPEQILGEPLSKAADLYALGVVVYEACSGRLPYQAETSFEMITRQLQEPPRPLGELRADLPPDLVSLTMRMLAREPGDRPASAAMVAERLAAFAEALENGKHLAG